MLLKFYCTFFSFQVETETSEVGNTPNHVVLKYIITFKGHFP